MLAGEECTVVSLSLVPPPLFLFGSDCVDRHLSCFAVPVLSAYVRMFVSSTYPLSLYARELCPSLHPPPHTFLSSPSMERLAVFFALSFPSLFVPLGKGTRLLSCVYARLRWCAYVSMPNRRLLFINSRLSTYLYICIYIHV